jgi:hypothetical protein
MGLYNFQTRFVPLIRSGRKCQTIRATRSHPDIPGATMHLYTGLRRRGARLLARVECIGVQRITITPSGRVWIGGVKLSRPGCESLARDDGFKDFSDMIQFWQGRLPFSGHIYYWRRPAKQRRKP